MEQKDGAVRAALLWGGAWGMWEATAGHLVHLLKVPRLPGIIMLPAALFFMSRASARGGRVEAIFLSGCLAASLKLVTILLPGMPARGAGNPALAILAEALAVTGLCAFFSRIAAVEPSKLFFFEIHRRDPKRKK